MKLVMSCLLFVCFFALSVICGVVAYRTGSGWMGISCVILMILAVLFADNATS